MLLGLAVLLCLFEGSLCIFLNIVGTFCRRGVHCRTWVWKGVERYRFHRKCSLVGPVSGSYRSVCGDRHDGRVQIDARMIKYVFDPSTVAYGPRKSYSCLNFFLVVPTHPNITVFTFFMQHMHQFLVGLFLVTGFRLTEKNNISYLKILPISTPSRTSSATRKTQVKTAAKGHKQARPEHKIFAETFLIWCSAVNPLEKGVCVCGEYVPLGNECLIHGLTHPISQGKTVQDGTYRKPKKWTYSTGPLLGHLTGYWMTKSWWITHTKLYGRKCLSICNIKCFLIMIHFFTCRYNQVLYTHPRMPCSKR